MEKRTLKIVEQDGQITVKKKPNISSVVVTIFVWIATVILPFIVFEKIDITQDKFFYLYLITNPHTNLCGCYEVSLKQMANETGYNEDTIKRLIDRFSAIHNIIRYSSNTKEVLLLNWYRYNWTSSPKLDKPLLDAIQKVKNNDFRNYLVKQLHFTA